MREKTLEELEQLVRSELDKLNQEEKQQETHGKPGLIAVIRAAFKKWVICPQ